jgi:hypothetical protein
MAKTTIKKKKMSKSPKKAPKRVVGRARLDSRHTVSSRAKRSIAKPLQRNGGLAAASSKEQSRVEALIRLGRERGYVTYDEILREFPTIEDNVLRCSMKCTKNSEPLESMCSKVAACSKTRLQIQCSRAKNCSIAEPTQVTIRYKCICAKSVSIRS